MKKPFLILLSLFSAYCCLADEAEQLKNRPELSLPLTSEKLVIAHNMTNIIRYKCHELEDSCDTEYYSPKGNITSNLGGLVQVYPLVDKYMTNASLEEAVEHEMRTAKKLGIDGFQFYYTLRKRGPDDEIIKAYFKVAEEKNIDFKLTLCISHPSGLTEDEKVHEFSKRINKIMDEVGRNNSHWLRTPDGRLIMYLWYGEQIADIPENADKPEAFYAARAFRKLDRQIGENTAYIYCINRVISDKDLNDYLDYFPAVWMWTIPYTDGYIGRTVAQACRDKNRTFTASTFSGFYTSKLLARGTWDMYHYAREAAQAGINNVERKGIVTGLSYNFRKLLDVAVEEDAPIINIITWNDYPEGHHLSPEINHNYGFSILLKHYKNLWKGKTSPYAEKDVAIAFYKKYRHDIKPDPYNIPIEYIGKAVPEEAEDVIEVVTLLKDDGEVTVNGVTKKVAKGLQSTQFAQEAGQVSVSVSRNGDQVLNFDAPEWITEHPYRTDRMIYAFSSEFMNFHKSIFGNLPPIYSLEYNELEKK
jgi:hypothetical protein